MSFYYQCECGGKVNKLTGELANSDREAKDLALYYEGQPIIECPKCKTKYKIKKPPRRNINIALVVGLIIAVILKLTIGLNFFLGLAIIYGMAFIAITLMIIFDNSLEKIDGCNDKESVNES